jgi:hypothetical protein
MSVVALGMMTAMRNFSAAAGVGLAAPPQAEASNAINNIHANKRRVFMLSSPQREIGIWKT